MIFLLDKRLNLWYRKTKLRKRFLCWGCMQVRFTPVGRRMVNTEELIRSQAELLVLLGDIPIAQYLNKAADVPFSSLGEFVDLYGYGNPVEVLIRGKAIKVLPLAHPRQIGGLGTHSRHWKLMHETWEKTRK